jgi:hypothetical protein
MQWQRDLAARCTGLDQNAPDRPGWPSTGRYCIRKPQLANGRCCTRQWQVETSYLTLSTTAPLPVMFMVNTEISDDQEQQKNLTSIEERFLVGHPGHERMYRLFGVLNFMPGHFACDTLVEGRWFHYDGLAGCRRIEIPGNRPLCLGGEAPREANEEHFHSPAAALQIVARVFYEQV